jgi:hypothetical protein
MLRSSADGPMSICLDGGRGALSGIGQRCGLWPGPLPMVAHKSLAATGALRWSVDLCLVWVDVGAGRGVRRAVGCGSIAVRSGTFDGDMVARLGLWSWIGDGGHGFCRALMNHGRGRWPSVRKYIVAPASISPR